ncbi:hypothetical protein JCM16138_16080 [Thermococcus atlanticus]
MPLLITYFKLSRLKEFSQALEKVDELRVLIPVEVANIELEDEKIKLVLHIPASSLTLVKRAFPEAVVLS